MKKIKKFLNYLFLYLDTFLSFFIANSINVH